MAEPGRKMAQPPMRLCACHPPRLTSMERPPRAWGCQTQGGLCLTCFVRSSGGQHLTNVH